MGLLEILTIGLVLAFLVGIVLAFILFMLHLKRKEDAAIKQFNRPDDEEVSHGAA
jgi:uncharacterized membrane protein affecting hemolysin expression